MKKLPGLLFCFCCWSALQAQYTIPDPAFAAKLNQIVPNAMDGDTLDEFHPDVTSLTTMHVTNAGISDLDGIQFFTSLEILNCAFNSLTIVDPPFSLRELHCSNNQLVAIGMLPVLEVLDCSNNQFTDLGTLPNTLQLLDCNANLLTYLPPLPGSLYSLNCRFNQISFLGALPSDLLHLYCSNNQLSILPILPDTLLELGCSQNELISLPSLPNTLEILGCFDNDLTVLPTLPNGLKVLSCSDNMLSSLPPLPNSIEQLSISANPVAELDSLPASLWFLACYDVGWTYIPPFPEGLESADISDNPISCLPWLPSTLQSLYASGTNISCLPNAPNSLDLSPGSLGFSPAICPFNNSCFPEELVTGSIFEDLNGDGTKDVNEPAMTLATVSAVPGAFMTGTFPDGTYVLPVDTGSFTVDGEDILYHIRTTAPHSVSLGVLEVDSLNDIGYQIVPGVYDLVANMSASYARPGFDNIVSLQVENIGTEPTLATIDLNFDTDQTWVTSTVAPDALAGNTATWTPTLAPGNTWTAAVTLNTDVAIPLGTGLYHTLSALPQLPDTTPANNLAVENDVVVGSFDPNDKLLEPGTMTPSQVQAGMPIEYTIRFQNTGTFPAERVVITDTLSSDLEWGTMDFVSSSHYCTWYLQDGVLHFIFDPIFLPDSTNDEPNSHGFVKFRMQPESNLMVGETVENVANIYFDFNEPVITEPAVFTVETTVGMEEALETGIKLWPNPASGALWLALPEAAPSTIEILDLTGKLLHSQHVNGAREQAVDIRSLHPGVYFVRVGNGSAVHTARFVKL